MPHRPFSSGSRPPAPSGPERAGWRVALAAGLFLGTATPALPSGFFERLFHHDVQVITSTDATPAGALLRPPSASEPVYYTALIAGYHVFGDTSGGEKLPTRQDAIRTIVDGLAQAGYLPADARHPASQVIMFTWGTLHPDVAPNLDNPDMPGSQLNYTGTVRFLGGDKLGLTADRPGEESGSLLPGLTSFSADATAISNVARESLYVVALAGFEFPVKQPKHPKLLWRTKVSCPATGLVLADTMPTMVAIAAPYLGHATSRPVWVNASDKFKPDVKVGNPKFEGYLGAGRPPAAPENPAPAKAAGDGK